MRIRIWTAVGLLGLLLATPVAALTVDDVIGLTRAKASDAVILAKIDADDAVFRLTVDEILMLKEAGVSDPVITYMINTGKLDVSEELPAQPEVLQAEPAPESEPLNEDAYNNDPSGQFGFGVGVSNGGFGISFGYYYPSWPGYSYGYYYDPFYWTCWPYYYSYYAPYPYYNWYYDPWYACNPYPHQYYDSCYGYGYGYDDGYYYDNYRVDKGRNVGNRGPVAGGDRIVKDPGTNSTSAPRASSQKVRLRDPNPDVAQAGPTVHRGKVLRPGQPDAQKVRSPSARNQVRSQPGKANVQRRSSQRGERTYTTSPQRQKAQASKPSPGHQAKAPQKQEQGGSHAKARNDSNQGSQQRSAPPARSWNGGGSGGGRSSPSWGGSRSGGGSHGGGGRGSSGGGRAGKGG